MGILSRCSSNSFIHASFYNVKLMHGLRAGCSSDTKSADPRQIQICKSIVDALWMWIRSLPMKTGRGLSNSYPYRALMIKLGTLSWTLGKIADFLFECPPRSCGSDGIGTTLLSTHSFSLLVQPHLWAGSSVKSAYTVQ